MLFMGKMRNMWRLRAVDDVTEKRMMPEGNSVAKSEGMSVGRSAVMGIAIAIGVVMAVGMSGCRAKREVVESKKTEERRVVVDKATDEERVNAVVELYDNIVVEKPEIVVQEVESGAMLTVRGERLVSGRLEKSEVAMRVGSVRDSVAIGEAESASERNSKTEGGGGCVLRYVLIGAIAAWLVIKLRRRMEED